MRKRAVLIAEMKAMKNTKERGIVRFLYMIRGREILGVCLDFNIVEEGTSIEEVKTYLQRAARLHLETVLDKGLSEELLNRRAPQEYWEIYRKVSSPETNRFPRLNPTSTSANTYTGKKLALNTV
ncbi:MAG: hypothetical protein Q8P99_01935 [bacterium]|nr:hypothetical protein [bacterium]